jgi:RNA polymerase sigma-70 factor (ECF subfamily)
MTDSSALVDHLFRREAGKIVAGLTRSLGASHLDLAEEAVQDAMIKALQVWPFRGIPANPSGWLTMVARNSALDRLRRDARVRFGDVPDIIAPVHPSVELDDQLALMFLCCHPGLSQDSQLALTLKSVCGFSVREIARAMLSQEAAIAQRLVRAKRQIREERFQFEIPSGRELGRRLDSVLRVVYLLFNEGYSASNGDSLLRADLCQEAVRLATIIADNAGTGRPESHALLALLLFQSARCHTRTAEDGRLLPLDEQDSRLWDSRLIALGVRRLDMASGGGTLSRYHIEAEIASLHATAGPTDWPRIRDLYDTLYEMEPSPVIALNRAVALARVEGPERGLDALRAIEDHPMLRQYHLLPAVMAELWQQAGDPEKAERYYRTSLERPCSAPERSFLERRLAGVKR